MCHVRMANERPAIFGEKLAGIPVQRGARMRAAVDVGMEPAFKANQECIFLNVLIIITYRECNGCTLFRGVDLLPFEDVVHV